MSRGYATLSWGEVVAKARSNEQFKAELTCARARLPKYVKEAAKEEEGDFILEDLADQTSVTLTLARSLLFVPSRSFEKEHGMTPMQAGVATTEVTDESGSKLSGVVIDDGKPRRLKVEVKQGLVLAKHLANAADMLRPEQTSDLFKFLSWVSRTSRRPKL